MGKHTRTLFIVSSGRSGTCMMKKLIGHNPNINMHHEYLCTHIQPISVKYSLGLIGADEARQAINALHGRAIELSESFFWGDSSNKLSWLIDVLNSLFPESLFIHIIRDGRKVVSSFFNKLGNECYDDQSVLTLQKWVDHPEHYIEPPPEKKYWWNVALADDAHDPFRNYNQFERICAHWTDINKTIESNLLAIEDNRKKKYKMEELVHSRQQVEDLFNFLDLEFPKNAMQLLATPHNVNIPKNYPLSKTQLIQFEKICGETMKIYDYHDKIEYKMDYHRKTLNNQLISTTNVMEKCDLCQHDKMNKMWTSTETKRGLSVYLCEKCALAQSLPRIDKINSKNITTSGGANWGNIRYGKGFQTSSAINFISEHFDIKKIKFCLDIGANRGSFVHKLLSINNDVHITAIEPDSTIMSTYEDNNNITAINERIENINLSSNKYDLIYCCHTLEHLKSPKKTLLKIRGSLKNTGVLYIEVPNIEFISKYNIVEEWFIDKHLFHFSPNTLTSLTKSTGFSFTQNRFKCDNNIIILLTKSNFIKPKSDSLTVMATKDLFRKYSVSMSTSQNRLRHAAKTIKKNAAKMRTVIWGAGRIFDRLVTIGGLDTSYLTAVIDKNLTQYIDEIHHCKLLTPDDFLSIDPELTVIASRAFYDEIRQQVLSMKPTCKVQGLLDILQES